MTYYDAPHHDAWSWDSMIQEFCGLGGVLKNVVPGERGLFAQDPAEPVLVRVPRELLIPVDHVTFVAGRIVIDEAAGVSEPVRTFFERYANTLGLRTRQASEAAAFVNAVAELPEEVRKILATDLGGGELRHADIATAIGKRKLNGGQVVWRGVPAIAPVIELARYDPNGLRPERGTNLQIQGYTSSEIRVRFATHDSLSAFCAFGSARPETAAFSLPMAINHEAFRIVIGRNPGAGKMRGEDGVPVISIDGQELSLSYLMLGNRKFPALPRGVCRALLAEAGIDKPDEAFDRVVRSNVLKFVDLLQGLEPGEGEMTSTLRSMARYQLEAISHCIGSRRLAAV